MVASFYKKQLAISVDSFIVIKFFNEVYFKLFPGKLFSMKQSPYIRKLGLACEMVPSSKNMLISIVIIPITSASVI